MKKYIITSVLTALIGYSIAIAICFLKSANILLFCVYMIAYASLYFLLGGIYKFSPMQNFELYASVFSPSIVVNLAAIFISSCFSYDYIFYVMGKSAFFALTTSILLWERFVYKHPKNIPYKSPLKKAVNMKKIYILTAIIGYGAALVLCFVPFTLETLAFHLLYFVNMHMLLIFVFRSEMIFYKYHIPYAILLIIAFIPEKYIPFDYVLLFLQKAVAFVEVTSLLLLERHISKNHLQKSRN